MGRPRTPAIIADLQKAAELADARNLNPEQILELSKYYVQRGISERKKQARSAFSPASPGATTEALGEHLKTAQDIGRENKFQEKIVLASPDDVVDSATKAIQTISENLTQQIKLYTNSLTDYAAATQRPGDDFPKMVKDSACQISKYMKVILQKQQEYTNKTMNAELTDVVAEMPSYMRAQFLDVKELNNENLLKSFNGITDDMCGLIEDILTQSLDINGLVEGAQQRAAQSDPFTVGESLAERLFDAATSAAAGGTTDETTTTSFGSNDSTTDLSEGSNQYFTNTRARSSVSVTDSGGLGSLGYNNSTGVITYAGPSNSDVRGLVSVASGSGLTYDNSTGEFGTNAIPNAKLANSSITLGSATVNLGDTVSGLSLTNIQAITKLQVGAEGGAGNIILQSSGITFEGSSGGADANETLLAVTDPTADRTITLPDATGTVALTTDISYPVTLNNSVTLTNKTLALGSNTISGTLAQFNTAVTDATLVSTTGTETLTNKSLTAPVLTGSSTSAGSIIFKEDTDNGTNSATLKGPASTADVTITLPAETGTVLTTASSIANSNLANSTVTIGSSAVALGSSITTLTGITSLTSDAVVAKANGFRVIDNTDASKQVAFDASGIATSTTRTLTVPNVSDTLVLLGATQTLTNKTIALGSNTVTGALANGITATTQSASDNSTKVATTAYVDNQVSAGAVNEFADNVFRVKDNSDATKKLAFECSGISGSTTRTLTVPDSNGTIGTEDFATAIAVALG